jgi:hypothetical protein
MSWQTFHETCCDPMVREPSIWLGALVSLVNGVDAFSALLPKLSVMTTARDRRLIKVALWDLPATVSNTLVAQLTVRSPLDRLVGV